MWRCRSDGGGDDNDEQVMTERKLSRPGQNRPAHRRVDRTVAATVGSQGRVYPGVMTPLCGQILSPDDAILCGGYNYD